MRRRRAGALLGLAVLLATMPACKSFLRDVSDIELPWTVLQSAGEMREVEFVVRPYFAVKTMYLAGDFNDWVWPGHGDGRMYEMRYDKERDYWTARVWLKAGAWQYVYIVDGTSALADLKNKMVLEDGTEVSRMVLR